MHLDARAILRLGLTALAILLSVTVGAVARLNVETWAQAHGLDRVWESAVLTSWLSFAAILCAGGALALWADWWLRRRAPNGVDNDKDLPADWESKLEVIEGKYFRHTDVPLDNRKYVKCKFDSVTFVYDGAPFALKHNDFFGSHGFKSNRASLTRYANLLFAMGFDATKSVLVDDDVGPMSLAEHDRRSGTQRNITPPASPKVEEK